MNCDASYITAMVDDLERAGYAERRAGPADRRVKTIALTPKAGKPSRSSRTSYLPHPLSSLNFRQRNELPLPASCVWH